MPAHPAEVEVVKSACIDLFKASAGQYLGHVHNNAPLFHPLLREQRSRIMSARGEAPRPTPHVPMRLRERRAARQHDIGLGSGALLPKSLILRTLARDRTVGTARKSTG